ncbi:GNAT family N-acetyltransferase [Paenibacillus sp. IHBB 10380]|uniref:GNAT family N-acetyltransferase n=1 Tax=Paenibacillus sp. IHBB 10380 TaxID=1566358 RepID=UPI001F39602C|nr:GNAT family N-acetyltransferase [Paenibacillus sp. IHBB 10380]
MSEYTDEDTKDDGKFDPTNTYLYLDREELHPYFIKYNNKIVGFILVCSPPFVVEGVDYAIQELFMLKKYRRKSMAFEAVAMILNLFPGRYKIEQLENNIVAVQFWKRFYKKRNIDYIEEKDNIEIDGLLGSHQVLSQTFLVPRKS